MTKPLKIDIEITINGKKYRPRHGWTGKTRCSLCAWKRMCEKQEYKDELGVYCNCFVWGFERVDNGKKEAK